MKIDNVRDLTILAEVEYCFSNQYDRNESVIGNEYNCLKRAYDVFSRYSMREIRNEVGDTPENLFGNEKIIPEWYENEVLKYISTCKTASACDKESATALVKQIVANNRKRNK